MAYKADELIAPKGEITTNMFPGESETELLMRMETYLTEGYGKTSNDDAAKHWSYHRAFKAVYVRMSVEPISSELADQASIQFDKDQARRFLDLSNEHYAAFQSLQNSANIEVTPRTQALNTIIRW